MEIEILGILTLSWIYNMLKLDESIFKKCDKALLISGSARSGTTLMGKIVHSFENVECIYEPPMMFSLFGLIDSLNKEEWKLLYETYLYEEFLMNALSGRSINCNRSDDSSIYNVKPHDLIEKRLSRTLRKVDAEKIGQSSQLAYKMPSIVPLLPKLKRYYPKTKIIIMLREAPDVFHSIIEKGWFSERSLTKENLIWPNRFLKGVRIPFWVSPEDDEEWIGMNELHRIAYYYIIVNEPVEKLSDCIKVKYSDLMENPNDVVRRIADKLRLSYGEKTEEILSSVRRRRTNVNSGMLEKLNPEVRDKVEHFSKINAGN